MYSTIDNEYSNETLLGILKTLKFDYSDHIIHFLERLTSNDTYNIFQFLINKKHIFKKDMIILPIHISIMMEIPECICIMLCHHKIYSESCKSLILFEHISDKMKQNIKVVCCFHRTIRSHFYIWDFKFPNDVLVRLENDELPINSYYCNLLNLIPIKQKNDLLKACKIIHRLHDRPILDMKYVYDMIYKLMLSFSISDFTKKIRNCDDMRFAFY